MARQQPFVRLNLELLARALVRVRRIEEEARALMDGQGPSAPSNRGYAIHQSARSLRTELEELLRQGERNWRRSLTRLRQEAGPGNGAEFDALTARLARRLLHPAMVPSWWTSENIQLDGAAPIHVLSRGGVDAVEAVVDALERRGFV